MDLFAGRKLKIWRTACELSNFPVTAENALGCAEADSPRTSVPCLSCYLIEFSEQSPLKHRIPSQNAYRNALSAFRGDLILLIVPTRLSAELRFAENLCRAS